MLFPLTLTCTDDTIIERSIEMSLAGIGGLLAGIGGIGSSIGSLFGLGYNHWLNKKMMRREDTAISRAAADMERAGLSKTLAAGNAASTGQPIKIGAQDMPNLAGPIHEAIAGAKGIVETQLMKEQVKAQELKNDFNEKWAPLKLRQESVKAAVDEKTMKDRIYGVHLASKGKMLQNRIKKADYLLKRKGLRQADVDYVKSMLQAKMLKKENMYKLSNLEIDLLAKELALDATQWDLDLSRSLRMRTGDKRPELNTMVGTIAEAFRGLDPNVEGEWNKRPTRVRSRFQTE